MAEKLIRDALGSPVPQLQNEDGTFTVLANGDSTGIDFSKQKLLRDMLGSPIPQYWNVTSNKWTVRTLDGSLIDNVDFSKTKLLRDTLGSPIPQLWDAANKRWVAQTEASTGGGIGNGSGGNTDGNTGGTGNTGSVGGFNTRVLKQDEYDKLSAYEKDSNVLYLIRG